MKLFNDLRFAALAPLIALLLLAGCASEPPIDPLVSADGFQQIIERLSADDMEGRDAGTDGIVLARDYLADGFRAMHLEPAFVVDGEPSYIQPFEVKVGRDEDGNDIMATVYNVGGILPGEGALADQVVVVGAHYDHVGFGHIGSRSPDQEGTIHPGADDNASGTAGVMLLAEYFVERVVADIEREGLHSTNARRSILFTCFAGEERGLLGSRYMTSHPDQWAIDGEKIVAMVNMDMVGRMEGNRLFVFGDESGTQWRRWTNRANRRVGIDLQWDVRAPGGSDHTPFISAGVPSVFFNTWLHADYHKPTDTADKINAQGGARILTLAALLIEEVATTDDRLIFSQPQRRPRPFLGGRLDSDDRGLFFSEITEDGPLAQAGAQVGDILLAIDGEPIADTYDFRRYLLAADPGDEADFVLRRGDETLEIEVEMGER